ncbi:MAG: dephospho-CoA kinase [Rickettsiales bacterium]|jgi:dephospho-CoA kinase
MKIIGLTGGVASGKNFVASHFKRLKIPVFDADFEVHKLFAVDAGIFLKIQTNFPGAIQNNKIDRKILGVEVLGNEKKLSNLEKIIYPKLRQKEDEFIKKYSRQRRKMVVLNIPLLFEKGGYKRCDKNIAVMASKKIQFSRFKKRFGKNIDENFIAKMFQNITTKQMNNLQRKNQADYLVNNGLSKAFSFRQIKNILLNI